MLEYSYYYQFPLNSDQFNKVISGLVAPGVYDGMIVTASAMTLAINVGEGKCLLPNGTTVWNTENLINPAACGINTSGNPRIDAVVMEYIHGSDPAINKPRVRIIDGTASVTPTVPVLNNNQVLLATIYLAGGATSFNNSNITNVERVVQVTTSATSYKHPDGSESTLTYDVDSPGFVSSEDVRTDTYLPASMLLSAAKMVMEGIYAGPYTLAHTFNDYNKPTSSLITISRPGLADLAVTVTYEYNANQSLYCRTLTTAHHQLRETYTYTNANSSLPNVVQTVTEL